MKTLKKKKYFVIEIDNFKRVHSEEFGQNVKTILEQQERRWPLGWGSISACSARKPSLVRLFSNVCHCTSLKRR